MLAVLILKYNPFYYSGYQILEDKKLNKDIVTFFAVNKSERIMAIFELEGREMKDLELEDYSNKDSNIFKLYVMAEAIKKSDLTEEALFKDVDPLVDSIEKYNTLGEE